MTLSYTWQIAAADAYPTLEVDGTTYNNVVHTVHWRLRAEDRDSDGKVRTVTQPNGTEQPLRAEVYGTINLDTSDPGADEFIDAQDLDEKTLAHWASVAMEAQEAGAVQALKDRLAAQIDQIANPPSVKLNISGEVNDSDV